MGAKALRPPKRGIAANSSRRHDGRIMTARDKESSVTGVVSGLDHIGIVAHDLAAIAHLYERLGFQLSPFSQHAAPHVPGGPALPIGSGNRCAMLRQGYIELLAIVDKTLPDNQLGAFLQRYEGIHIVALAVDDAAANVARLHAAGLTQAKIAPLQRMAATPDGEKLAAFARIPLPPGEAPEGRIQLIQHLTPEILWQTHLLDHPNRAVALADTIVCVADPDESMRRFARLTGVAASRIGKGWRFAFSQGRLTLVPSAQLADALPGAQAAALPFIAGYVVTTDDRNHAVLSLLKKNGIAWSQRGDDIIVGAPDAGGATLMFSTG
jgi:catechol 2,3-dioxygenase-like lactoylglutathione lyase family enzyme